MLYFVEIILYVVLSITLLGMAMQRPIWGVGYYMLNYFAQPAYWGWGAPLQGAFTRWSLLSGFVLLAAVVVHQTRIRFRKDAPQRRVELMLILLLINSVIVHYALAYPAAITTSLNSLIEIAKFVLLYYIIIAAVQSRDDFVRLIWFFALGIGYWGFEAKFVGVTLTAGRLEGFGGPGCAGSNELASITVALLPLLGGLLFITKGIKRLGIIAITLLVTNILMLCNSRGGFLSLIVIALSLPFLAPGKSRALALNGLAAGAVAVFLLAGNPEILARFLSVFESKESAMEGSGQARMDYANKESRMNFWKSGLDLIQDNPIGNGGGAFNGPLGNKYFIQRNLSSRNRSVHQGYIDTAIEWGVQGLLLRLAFVGFGAYSAFKTAKFRSRLGDVPFAFFGACIIGGIFGWLFSALFGDLLHLEWGYWLVILACAYTKIFGETNYGLLPDVMMQGAGKTNQIPGSNQQLAAAGV